MTDERFLVTGGTGCIGSWVVRNLVRDGAAVTVLSSRGRLDRLRLVLTEAELAGLQLVEGEVTDLDLVEGLAREAQVTGLIHLAAMQFPFCAADPIGGARVNVQGTVTMFEAAKRLGIGRLVYASSAAVYGPKTRYAATVLPSDAELYPTSHYGVYKVANEQTARVYHANDGISSIGLRPHSAYGPGRDQGVTSRPTVAMIAAAAGRPYRIDFGGAAQFQYVDDVARAFVAAARSEREGAEVYSLGGPRISVDEIVAAIEAQEPWARGRITHGDNVLPFPEAFDGAPLDEALGRQPLTPLADGVRLTIEAYRAAILDGRVDDAFLDRVVGA